jgi:flagellum-specific peptidoglycan hydrolase FlgJ
MLLLSEIQLIFVFMICNTLNPLVFSFCLLFSLTLLAQEQQNEVVLKYINQYKEIAIKEMKMYGVPASITLSQGIIESNSGRSTLAVNGNNHFGIKCHNTWYGKTIIEDDDVKNECFRKYENPEESFRDHSEFLKTRERYAFLFKYATTDYKSWAYGLKQAGYATNPKYAEILVRNIETYQLYRFDDTSHVADNNNASIEPTPLTTNTTWASRIFLRNNIKAVYLMQNESLSEIGKLSGQGLSRILKYNDLSKNLKPADGSIIYLQPKRRKGSDLYHTVAINETMYLISQQYGIHLKDLYHINNIALGEEPAIGEIIYLRNKRSTTPILRKDKSVKPQSNSGHTNVIIQENKKDSTNKTNVNTTTPTDETKNNSNSISINTDNSYYTVQSGDTLYGIARVHNTSVEKLKELNEFQTEIIHAGMRIRIK